MSYPPYGYQGYPGYGYGPPQDHPQATTILVIGILSLVFCQILGPVAWIMGSKARKEIDHSGGAIGGRGNVTAGWVCGIIASCLLILAVVIYGGVILVSVVAAASGS
ncbi:DUF4190 domain-containing protein [Nocardia sp. NPDC050406]|uniref:DUF4190 domain-containing protein n=1 Tax=Nocardia sp. NPDC050406 TaxID=3364318 RepID=UPI0037BCA68B